MKQIRFAVIGAGFWARFQLSAWREAGGAACVAICNRTRSRAEELAHSFNIPAVYTDPDQMLAREQVDCVDIISAVEAHEEHVRLAAGRG
ncbi:MAG TPA: Gfo/Idh/MocA family oxidoreductase, partial [Spirochaetia bacterium]|nr:Gfo/Idh/MocA family oxidoreductase [Spirochaetia bacterium]